MTFVTPFNPKTCQLNQDFTTSVRKFYSRYDNYVLKTVFVNWVRRAAEYGFARAQHALGTMYMNGEGVPKDDVQAYMWLSQAAARGVTAAAQKRDRLASLMSSAQIAEAEKLVREWKPKRR